MAISIASSVEDWIAHEIDTIAVEEERSRSDVIERLLKNALISRKNKQESE